MIMAQDQSDQETENLNIETTPTLPPWLQAANPAASFAQGLAMIAGLRGRAGSGAAPGAGTGMGTPAATTPATAVAPVAQAPAQAPASSGVPGYNLSTFPTQGGNLAPTTQAGGIINPQTGAVDPTSVLGLGLGPIDIGAAVSPGGTLDPSSLGSPNIPLTSDISTMLNNLFGAGDLDQIGFDYGLD
jgi:hypothetical protein